jgi:hypothetical protein
VTQRYVTVLFGDAERASEAKRALETLSGIRVHRMFLVARDAGGMRVDGRYGGELPKIDNLHPLPVLATALARLIRGSSREEDGVAVEGAEENLAVGQAAIVALVDERDQAAIDRAMREYGGAVTRRAVETVDAEDTQRFLSATSLDEPSS